MVEMGFGLQHYDTGTGPGRGYLYPDLWICYCSSGEGWSWGGPQKEAKWFATQEEAQAHLDQNPTNAKVVPLEKPPAEITERRQISWKLLRQAKDWWPYLSDWERQSYQLDDKPVEEVKIKPSLQIKLESDLATACQEIDRLHKELSEARHGDAQEKLTATLEWYADPTSYYDPMHWNNQPEVLIDGGTRARLTLAEIKR